VAKEKNLIYAFFHVNNRLTKIAMQIQVVLLALNIWWSRKRNINNLEFILEISKSIKNLLPFKLR
jgi:hypothetical protein